MKLIKVCGMKEAENLSELEALKPDFIGFIFYPKSPRFVGENFSIQTLKTNAKKVGVFVNESIENILQKVEKHQLDFVQLHSHESPEFCRQLKREGLGVLKSVATDSDTDFDSLKEYESVVDYFLFDTKGLSYGGHGVAFDWSILENYHLKTPFFVAGGISNDNIEQLLHLHHPLFAGIDVNSKYEIAPGEKDIEALRELFLKVKPGETYITEH